MNSPIFRAVGFFVLFTLLSSTVSWFREEDFSSDIVIDAAIVGAITAVLLYFWQFRKAKS